MKKICFVATVPDVVHAFLRGHIRTSAKTCLITIITNSKNAVLLGDLNARLIPLTIWRKPSPCNDLIALIRLMALFRRERFNLIHSIMPKTGLLSMLAGKLTGVPVRVHTFTGQVWSNKKGWKRAALKIFDKMIVAFATHILIDSPSQRDFLINEGVLPKDKGEVIGYGSICGVDKYRFYPNHQMREAIRTELNIGFSQTVILFLGRLNRDKGILDLVAAFAEIITRQDQVVLALVGAEEDILFSQIQAICGVHHGGLRRVGFTPYPERYMAASDILCLPSYREGFGQVIIEAAACGVPTVASRIYGITDAVVDGKTGKLFPAGNVAALTQILSELIDDHTQRNSMGIAAQARALELFSSERISSEMIRRYEEMMTCQ